jgi:hypothetical protein
LKKKKAKQVSFSLQSWLVHFKLFIDYFKNLNYPHVDIEDMVTRSPAIVIGTKPRTIPDNRGSTIIIE